MFSLDSIISIFSEYSSFAIIISIFMSTIIAILGVVPSIVITGANIAFFGPLEGFIVSLIGETIGGYVSFILYRLGFKKKIEGFKDKNKLLKAIAEGEGKRIGFLIFEGRLIPFIPSGFVTLAASISNVNEFIFIISTFFGKVPSIALESLISYDLINIEENFIRLIITLVAIVLVYMTLKKYNKEKNKG